MAKIDLQKEEEPEAFRYSKIPGGTNAFGAYVLVSLVKGIVWLVKTPIKWVIRKVKYKQ